MHSKSYPAVMSRVSCMWTAEGWGVFFREWGNGRRIAESLSLFDGWQQSSRILQKRKHRMPHPSAALPTHTHPHTHSHTTRTTHTIHNTTHLQQHSRTHRPLILRQRSLRRFLRPARQRKGRTSSTHLPASVRRKVKCITCKHRNDHETTQTFWDRCL